MDLDDDNIRTLLQASAETRDVEIDCDGFLAVMAELAETRVAGREPGDSLVLAVEHERRCWTCREECAALVETITEPSPQK